MINFTGFLKVQNTSKDQYYINTDQITRIKDIGIGISSIKFANNDFDNFAHSSDDIFQAIENMETKGAVYSDELVTKSEEKSSAFFL